MGYTWAQFSSYLHLARQQRALDRRDQLVDASHAFGGGDGARALLKMLNKLAEG